MAGVMPDGWAIPATDQFNAPFFTSGNVALQQCSACRTVQHPPEEVCHACLGMAFQPRETSGLGTIYSFIVVHHAVAPTLKDVVPYAVVLVSLDDEPQVRVLGNVLGRRPDELEIGQRVRAVFEEVVDAESGEKLLIPQWELAE
jgi:uncharacterized OB-fold protein